MSWRSARRSSRRSPRSLADGCLSHRVSNPVWPPRCDASLWCPPHLPDTRTAPALRAILAATTRFLDRPNGIATTLKVAGVISGIADACVLPRTCRRRHFAPVERVQLVARDRGLGRSGHGRDGHIIHHGAGRFVLIGDCASHHTQTKHQNVYNLLHGEPFRKRCAASASCGMMCSH